MENYNANLRVDDNGKRGRYVADEQSAFSMPKEIQDVVFYEELYKKYKNEYKSNIKESFV